MNRHKQVFLLLTHFYNEAIVQKYNKLRSDLDSDEYDIFVLLHSSDGTLMTSDCSIPCYVCSNEQLATLKYKSIAPTLLPGSCHFPLMYSYLNNSRYKFYWMVEYDVCFSGGWNLLMDDFKVFEFDLLSAHVEHFDESVNGDWTWWKRCNDSGYDISKCIKSFNPICRFSSRALACLDSHHRMLRCAHSEVFIPTVLFHSGMTLADIGGCGEFVPSGFENKYYIRLDGVNNGTIRYRPEFDASVLDNFQSENLIFHPVKSPYLR